MGQERFGAPLKPVMTLAWRRAYVPAGPSLTEAFAVFVEDVDLDGAELTATLDGRAITYGLGELDASAGST
jgi:hypothetical protein